MNTNQRNRHFTLIVAGEQPDRMIKPYNRATEVERHVVYKFSDREKLFNMKKKIVNGLIDQMDKDDVMRGTFVEEKEYLDSIDAVDYFEDISYGYEIDEETGDAYSTLNEKGTFDDAKIGGVFALPFKTKNGKEVYQARKKDIAWDQIHHCNREVYESAWDCVMEGKKPSNEQEEQIYNNMKNRTAYFENFETRENYVEYSTAFWGFAFLSEETGWQEITDSKDSFSWVNGFMDRFIKPLNEDTLLTIYECIRI